MKSRIISALLMLPLLLFFYIGGIHLLFCVAIITFIGLHEFYKGFKQIDIHPVSTLGYLSLIALYLIIIWGEFVQGNSKSVYAHLLYMWICGTVIAGLYVGLFSKNLDLWGGIITSIGVLYIGFFGAHVVLITRIEKYSNFTWLVLITALFSDIFAYFFGIRFGKHRLCPNISPHKSIEGCIAGIFGSVIACISFSLIFYPQLIWHCIVIGILGSILSQTGDLVASLFKRKMGIKDFGNIIPGHGGVMDRIDSILFTAPFIYYYILVVLRP